MENRESKFLSRTLDGEAQFLAVPVPGRDGSVTVSIGISMPVSRFKGGHRKDVVEKLKQAGSRMIYALLDAKNWRTSS